MRKKYNILSTAFLTLLLHATFATHAYAFDFGATLWSVFTIFIGVILPIAVTGLSLYYYYNAAKEKSKKEDGGMAVSGFLLDFFDRSKNFATLFFIIGLLLPLSRMLDDTLSGLIIFFTAVSITVILTVPVVIVLSYLSLKTIRGALEFREADMTERGKTILMMIIENSIAENITLTILFLGFLWLIGIADWVLVILYL